MRALPLLALALLLAACEVETDEPDVVAVRPSVEAETPAPRAARVPTLRDTTAARERDPDLLRDAAPPPPAPDLVRARENDLPVVERIDVRTWNAASGAYESVRGPIRRERGGAGTPVLAVVTVRTDPSGATPPVRLRGVEGGAEVFSQTVRLGTEPGAGSAPFVVPGDRCEPLTLTAPSRGGEVSRTVEFACGE